MTRTTLIAAALGLTASLAHAQATFSYGASVADDTLAEQPAIEGLLSEGALTTGGSLVVESGGLRAVVDAVADPTAGSFKSFTSAVVTGGSGAYADAYARLDLFDTLNFSGPGATVEVQFTLSWDTRVSGVDSLQAAPVPGPFDAMLQTESTAALSLSYGPEALRVSDGGAHTVFTEAVRSAGGGLSLHGTGGVGSLADGNGRFSGQTLITMIVPTGQDIALNYFAFNSSRCIEVLACSITTDASHSDYLGLNLAQGYSFTSQNGYQYLGQTPAVPEPEGWLLGMVGVALAVARARRAPAQRGAGLRAA